MIYAKHVKTIFDDSPTGNMEYGPKIRHSGESRNPEGPIHGEIRLLKQAPRPARVLVTPYPSVRGAMVNITWKGLQYMMTLPTAAASWSEGIG